MEDKTLALLGDKAAQERLTERGELLPCPFCGGEGITRGFNNSRAKWISCETCFCDGETAMIAIEAIENWNTRAPILTPEQLERLQNDEYGKKISGIEYKRLAYCMMLKKACSKCRIHKEMKIGETCSEFAERNPELTERLVDLGAIRD